MSELFSLIIANAAYYRVKLEDSAVRLHAEDLEDLPIEEVKKAYAQLRRDPKVKAMPMPAEIRSRLQPVISDDEEAKQIAATIIGCVTRYGYVGSDSAKEEIGEIGWDIIRRLGGWASFCEGLNDFNVTTFQAQIRDLASVSLKEFQGARHALSSRNPKALAYTNELEKLAIELTKQKQIEL